VGLGSLDRNETLVGHFAIGNASREAFGDGTNQTPVGGAAVVKDVGYIPGAGTHGRREEDVTVPGALHELDRSALLV
jgi:hypothetical protein